jgi:hypothetical protein
LRRVKKATKAHEEAKTTGDAEQIAACEHALHIAQVDNAYAQFTPLAWDYKGLWPRGADEGLDPERPRKGDPDMWDRVEKAMVKGTLENLKNELTVEEEISIANDLSKGEEPGANDDDDGEFFE